MFAVMSGAGLLLIWVARATASGKIKRNAVAGIRTRKTMASDEAWLAAHVRAKTPTLLASVATLLPMGLNQMMVVVMVANGITFVLVAYGAIVGGRAADAVTSSDEA